MVVEPREHLKKVYRVVDRRSSRLEFVRLDRNERSTGFPKNILKEIFSDIHPDFLSAYPQAEPFYIKLAQWLNVNRDNLLIASGSDVAIKNIFETYVKPGDEIIMVLPSYDMYPVYCDMYNCIKREINYNSDFEISVEEILDCINPKTKLVALVNPNQPIIRGYTEQELIEILEKTQKNDAILLVDEAYHHFYPHSAISLIEKFDNLLITRTFSKAFGIAGLRLGYIISQPENIANVMKVKPAFEADSIALKVAEYLLDHDDIMKSYVKDVDEGRGYLVEELEKLSLSVFSGKSNLLLIQFPNNIAADEITNQLKEQGFLVRCKFNEPPLNTNHFIRVTLGPKKQMIDFMNALKNTYIAEMNMEYNRGV